VEALVVVSRLRISIAALTVCGLGAYIYFIELPRVRTEAETALLLRFDPDRASALRLRYPDHTDIALERRDGRWRLVEPIAVAADEPTIDRLLRQIQETAIERRIPASEAEDLSVYGLAGDGEQARVTIALSDGTILPDIVVGRTTPVGFQAFARLEDSHDVLLTPLIFHTGIKKSIFELREKRIFTVDPTAVAKIRLHSGSDEILLERRDARWTMITPLVDLADENQVQTILSSIVELEALEFPDDSPPRNETSALLEFGIVMADGSESGLRVEDRRHESIQGYHASRLPDGLAVVVPEWVASRFRVDVDEIRNKRLFDCDANEIVEMRFRRADGTGFALIENPDKTWRLEPPAERPVRTDLALRRRNALATVAGNMIVASRALDAAGLAIYGLDAPAADVEIISRQGESCGRALGGIVDSETGHPTYYVKRAQDGIVMSVPEYLFSRLSATPAEMTTDTAATGSEP
jgi:hypothetical protein